MLKRLLNVIRVELSKTNKSDEFRLKLLISKVDAEKRGLELPIVKQRGIKVPRITNADIMREILEIKSDVNSIDKRLEKIENTPTVKRELKNKDK